MGFKRILVAIDRSPLATEIFEQALDLAQKQRACLMLFHCLNREDWLEAGPLLQTGVGLHPFIGENLYQFQQEHFREAVQEAQQWLETYRQKATTQGVPAEFCYGIQNPGLRICNLARSWGADLILLGRRGRRGLKEMLLGSVSNYVVHHAPCSVLIAQGTTPGVVPATTTSNQSSTIP